VACELTGAVQIRVAWVDNSTFETEFRLEVSVNGSPFVPMDVVPSTTMATTGTPYIYNIPVALLASTDYQFRVQARNLVTAQNSEFTSSGVCTTGIPFGILGGCVDGQVQLQGRAEHAGVPLYMDGFPAGVTGPGGNFEVCNVLEGAHTFAARSACYLGASTGETFVTGGETSTLPYTSLVGGDVTGNQAIDLYDLVRVGADYRSQPPADPAADCTGDGAVNLFDLVMVGANYDQSGPGAWGGSSAVQSRVDAAGTAARIDWSSVRTLSRGSPRGAPVVLEAEGLDDDTLTLAVTARGVAQLYGADFVLRYDPARLRPIDALAGEPGIQAEPGAAWGSDAYTAVNLADRASHELRFAASLRQPEQPLSGDVVIATVQFRVLGDDAEGAYGLDRVRLADRDGQPIGASWTGIEALPDIGSLIRSLFLPWNGRGGQLRPAR
jgi:hypothetical protein